MIKVGKRKAKECILFVLETTCNAYKGLYLPSKGTSRNLLAYILAIKGLRMTSICPCKSINATNITTARC